MRTHHPAAVAERTKQIAHRTDRDRALDDSEIVASGYRLQLTLVDLIDLQIQSRHLRWNVESRPLRHRLEMLDTILGASASIVADRMQLLGIAPDARVATAFQDLLFDPLAAGPFGIEVVEAELSDRLDRFLARLSDSITIIAEDEPSARLLSQVWRRTTTWAGESRLRGSFVT
jgi:DNA-binding ferritin-like protein